MLPSINKVVTYLLTILVTKEFSRFVDVSEIEDKTQFVVLVQNTLLLERNYFLMQS